MPNPDRWDGNVHYYDYTPATVRRVSNHDAFTVGEAFAYDEGEGSGGPVGIVMCVSAQDLRRGVDLATAIATAQRILPTLVTRHAPEVRGGPKARTYVYTWNGQLLAQEEVS